MSEELVDIVDLQDRLTGRTMDLTAAHKNKVPHRVSAVLIFRPSGKLIVQRHKYHDRKFDHSVGGHVSAGETYLDAAKREMQEELRLKSALNKIVQGVVSHEFYAKKVAGAQEILHIFGVFTAKVSQNWQLVETDEVDEVVEMTVKELVKMMNEKPDKFLQGFMTSLGAYLRYTGSKQRITAYGKNWGEL